MTSLTMQEAVARLIEALEPLAAMYDARMDSRPGGVKGEVWGYNDRVLRIEDLKRARELLDRLKEESMNWRNA